MGDTFPPRKLVNIALLLAVKTAWEESEPTSPSPCVYVDVPPDAPDSSCVPGLPPWTKLGVDNSTWDLYIHGAGCIVKCAIVSGIFNSK